MISTSASSSSVFPAAVFFAAVSSALGATWFTVGIQSLPNFIKLTQLSLQQLLSAASASAVRLLPELNKCCNLAESGTASAVQHACRPWQRGTAPILHDGLLYAPSYMYIFDNLVPMAVFMS
jgi:hypothetical protein